MNNYQREYYALQNVNGDLIGLDLASGGYPYVGISLMDIWFVIDPKKMIEYNKTCHNAFKLVKVTVTVEEVKS